MNIHFMGILGSGVAGVASLASKMGYEVTGCDLEEGGHDAGHLKGIDLLVVTPAVFWQSKADPELVEGQRRGMVMTWQEFLGKVLLKDRKVIAVAGTHGKSTTTAMASKLLIDSGLDPICVVGAHVPGWRGNSRFGMGDWAVVEADEFNNNFLNYKPEIAIVTNIEFDHPDFFKNEDEVRKSFEKFVKQSRAVITRVPQMKFKLKLMGEHNQKNASTVYALGKKLGISDEKIVKSIESFKGIGRRMELIGKRQGVKVYDDYAHHPTAIKTTLEGLREQYPKAKILAIIEAHGYKRTKALLPKYKGVFDAADGVIIGPIFKARDSQTFGMTPEKIAEVSGHPNIEVAHSLNEIIENLKLKIKNYHVVVVMGAGKSNLWARKIADAISGQAKKTFRELTSFRTGGEIAHYEEVATRDELVEKIKKIKEKKLPIFILGDGTDILVSDSDFNGAVIKYTGRNISFAGSDVTSEAGVEWDDLVSEAVKRNLQGIECLSGIPGSVGAAPIQNIGAYGQELKDTFVSLTAYDIEKEKFIVFDGRDCGFSYRESIFKKPKNWQRFIITDITLKLKKYNDPEITLKNISDEILRVRSEKFESPDDAPNAGSFFKNPVVDSLTLKSLLRKFPDIKHYGLKLSAGWLIEKAGWKGKNYKGAAVSSRHALVLTNPKSKAKANEILELSEKIIDDVYKKFGVKLEREVQLVNFGG